MITDKHPYLDEGYDWTEHHESMVRLHSQGFVELPDWMPTPPPDCYESVIVGGIDAFIRPKPKFQHWLRWGIWPLWLKRIKWRLQREKNLFLVVATIAMTGCEPLELSQKQPSKPLAKWSRITSGSEIPTVYRLEIEGQVYLITQQGGIVLHVPKEGL